MSLTRRQSREEVFKLLFEAEFQKEIPANILLEDFIINCENDDIANNEYIKTVFLGAMLDSVNVEELINKFSVGWNIKRISKVSLAVIKLAVYEIAHLPDVAVNIAINEAIELSKKYDDEKMSAFVNGILGKISKEINICEKNI